MLSINYILGIICAFNKTQFFIPIRKIPTISSFAQSILEPGYYQDGEFGIRLETIVMTTKLDLPVSKPSKVVQKETSIRFCWHKSSE